MQQHDGPRDDHTKWSISDIYHMISLACDSNKMIKMNLFTKQKWTHRHRKQTYHYQWQKGGEKDRLRVWDKHVHTTMYIVDKQQGPTDHTGALYSISCHSL